VEGAKPQGVDQVIIDRLGIITESQSKGTAGLERSFVQRSKDLSVDVIEWRSARPMKAMEILSSLSDLNQPTLNDSQRVRVLSKVFLQCCPDIVGVPVPVGEKVDDHALLVLHLICALRAVRALM
jgi:hypothetical protein